MSNIPCRRTALVALLLIGLSGTTVAATAPSSGLGQAWPNATDVSASPNWHAYVFVLGGIEFVQINDINGNVIGAVGTANGAFIILPVGRYAQLVSTPQQPAAATTASVAAAPPTTVYRDTATTITATPMSDGTVKLNAMGTAICDPLVCSSHGAPLSSGTIKLDTEGTDTCDPLDCNTNLQ
ncbi:hypothetical protein [Dyella agri]|uniref:Uncharacterized protein n=1 Tax=Dyella agri TaxID=1926869 RepID=A0ABW8KJ69_9GAMM